MESQLNFSDYLRQFLQIQLYNLTALERSFGFGSIYAFPLPENDEPEHKCVLSN